MKDLRWCGAELVYEWGQSERVRIRNARVAGV